MLPPEHALRVKAVVTAANEMHVCVNIFAGRGLNSTLAKLGDLCMDVGEYQVFFAALGMGAERTRGHMIFEMDDRIFRAANGIQTPPVKFPWVKCSRCSKPNRLSRAGAQMEGGQEVRYGLCKYCDTHISVKSDE